MINRALDLDEEPFLFRAFRTDVGNLPDSVFLQRVLGLQGPRPHTIPCGHGITIRSIERTLKPQFLLAHGTVGQTSRHLEDQFGRFPSIAENGVERTCFRCRMHARQFGIGPVGVNNAFLAVENDHALRLAVQKRLRKGIASGARRDLDEADD